MREPELPPNADSWERAFRAMHNNGEVCPDDIMRPLRAAFYRTNWLDIAASVRGASGLSADTFGVHATIRPNPEWLHAMKQADLWAKWGKNAD